ncbi:MAG: PAS domain S-box protein, partial [FCB group bacterium]
MKSNIPIIILTGLDDEASSLKAVSAGAQDYLVKGVINSYLLRKSIRYAIERKKSEENIIRLNKLYDFLSQVNQSIVHVKEKNNLFQIVCDSAIQHGGFKIAWLGIINESKEIIETSSFCMDTYYNNIEEKEKIEELIKNYAYAYISTNQIIPEVYYCNDILNDEDKIFLHGAVKKLDLNSFAFLPIKLNGKIIGVFSVFSNVINLFQEKEIEMLKEVAGDISFALEMMLNENIKIKTELALKESEERYREIFENAQIGIYRTTPEGRILAANPAIVQMLGYSSFEDLSKRNLEDEGYPSEYSRNKFKQLIEENNEVICHESVWKKKDGSLIYVNENAHTVFSIDGTILYYEGTVEDITERKNAAESVIASELRYRRLFESAKDGILILDAETGIVVDVNPFLIKLLGFSHEQFLEKEIWELGFFKDVIANKEKFMELQQVKYVRYEDLPLKTKNGQIRDVEFVSNVYQVNHKKVIQCNIRDITERKEAEEALKESEIKFRSVFNNSRDALFVSKNGIHSFSNLAFADLFGYTDIEELSGKSILDFVAPSEYESISELVKKRLQGLSTSTVIESRGLRKNGTEFDFEGNLSNYVLDDEKFSLIIIRDITERKLAEAEIEQLAKFPSENPNPVLRFSKEGILLYANEASNALLRYWNCSIGERIPDAWHKILIKSHNSGLSIEIEIDCEFNIYSLIITPISVGGYTNIYGRDITEKYKAEIALKESEEKWRSLVNNSPDFIALHDKEGRFLYMNHYASGFDEKEVIGTYGYNYIAPEFQELWKRKAEECLNTWTTQNLEYTALGDNETMRNYENYFVPIKNKNNEINILAIARDITDNKQAVQELKESEEKFKTIFNSTSDGMFLVDLL